MAGSWYHASVQSIGRSSGRSAVAAAAYRAAALLHDERTGLTYDYTRKGGVEWSAVLLPENAPAAFADPARLWNAAEKADNRKNSVTARELELALPGELPEADRRRIAEDVARFLVERYGVAAHVAIHRPHRDGDQRNHHAHILFTTRRLDRDGLTEKTRELDAKATRAAEVEAIREAAAKIINRELERAGIAYRVDHRSYERQGKEQKPTKHLGPAASEMERRGEGSDRGDKNREIEAYNREREQIRQEAEIIDFAIEREKRRLALIEEQNRAADQRAHDRAQQRTQKRAQYTAGKTALYEEKERRVAAILAESRDQHRRFWQALYERQERERRDLEQGQRAALSRLAVWLKDRRAGWLAEPERGVLSGAFRAVTGKDAALERLEQRHERERAELREKINERTRPALAEINTQYRAELAQLRETIWPQRQQEPEHERERATGTDGPTYATPAPELVREPDPAHETEEQAAERRRAFLAEIYQERARLRSNDRERDGPER